MESQLKEKLDLMIYYLEKLNKDVKTITDDIDKIKNVEYSSEKKLDDIEIKLATVSRLVRELR